MMTGSKRREETWRTKKRRMFWAVVQRARAQGASEITLADVEEDWESLEPEERDRRRTAFLKEEGK